MAELGKEGQIKLAVQVGTVADGSLGSAIQYCKDLEVSRLVVPFDAVPGFRDMGYLRSEDLRGVKAEIEDAGLGCSVMVARVSGRMRPSTMIMGGPEAEAQFGDLCRSMESMGEAGLDTLLMFVILERPQDPKQEDARWGLLVDFYRKLMAQAERCDVKIAAHTVARPDRNMLWNYEAVDRLMRDVPSPCNGVTFCIGNFWLSEGEDMYNVMRRLGEKLFFVHLRSTKLGLGETPFWFDSGGPDYSKIIQALKDIDYRGDMRAEHMPKVVRENRTDIGTAWAIAYTKALLQFL